MSTTADNEKSKLANYTAADFKKAVKEVSSFNSVNGKGSRRNNNKERKTPEEIDEILLRANGDELRALSREYWMISGLYKRLLVYVSTMLTYDTMVTPKYRIKAAPKENEKQKLIDMLENVTDFLDMLNIQKELPRVIHQMLVDGAYYGFFKEEGEKAIFQDLDPQYCRSRYKSMNDLPMLEFDLFYFLKLESQSQIRIVNEIDMYPKYVIKAFKEYISRYTDLVDNEKKIYKMKPETDRKLLEENRWLLIPENLGIVIYYKDFSPFFATVIESIENLQDYKGLEKKLDAQELKKILSQELPINNEGELVFTLEEGAEIHAAIAEMLKNNEDVDVLTTFAKTNMLDVQDSKQANRDNLEKTERSVYNEAGVSKGLFATDSSVALEFSIIADFALIYDIAKTCLPLLNYHINRKFARKNFFLEVSILPITHYNREEMVKIYLQGAQYGYSKIMAGVASGIKQSNLLNIIDFENNYLDLATKMIPLQSSHTTSGKDITASEGGAPEKDDKEQSDKTKQNKESQ